MDSEEKSLRFACDFGGGVSATVTIDVEALRKGGGKVQYLEYCWTGKPGKEHKGPYREWMLQVQQRAADLLPGRIVWAFPVGAGQVELYALEAGKPYRRIN